MKLARYLEDRGLTPTQFAALIGVSSEAVRRYRDGARTPRPGQMRRIAEVTHGEVQPNDFLPPAPVEQPPAAPEPAPAQMRKIVEATKGEVEPNDFLAPAKQREAAE